MSFANDARPRNLDTIIGHTAIVDKLKEYVENAKAGKNLPNVIGFFGPTSAGKTTLARAFAASLFEDEAVVSGTAADYTEIDMGTKRTIDDVRQLSTDASYSPMLRSHKVIVLDECQSVISNATAATALLKSLEDAPKSTIWIIASMEADKFGSTQVGRAILNRSVAFHLKEFTVKDRLKYAKRIARQQELTITLEQVTELVERTPELRNIAHILEGGEATLVTASDTFDMEVDFLKIVVKAVDTPIMEVQRRAMTWAWAHCSNATTLGENVRRIVTALSSFHKLVHYKGRLPNGHWPTASAKAVYAAVLDSGTETLTKLEQGSMTFIHLECRLSDVLQFTMSAGMPVSTVVPPRIASIFHTAKT